MSSLSPALPSSVAPRIGVFDSGLGGLSVLAAIRRRLPQAELLYVADSGFAPYGERGEAFVVARSLRIAEFLRLPEERTRQIVVMVPAAEVRGRDLDTEIELQHLRQRPQNIRQRAVGVVAAAGREGRHARSRPSGNEEAGRGPLR